MKTSKATRPFDTLDFIERNVPKDPNEIYRYGDIYSLKDHSIVKRAVREALSDDEQGIIVYSFWSGYSVAKIAQLMSMGDLEVRQIYSSALQKIRKYCLNENGFSHRTEAILEQAA